MYYVMSTEYDAFNNPDIARYDNDRWVISGDAPKVMPDNVMDLSQTDKTIDELVLLVDYLRTLPPTGMLLIIPEYLGRHLYKTHTAFMPVNEEI